MNMMSKNRLTLLFCLLVTLTLTAYPVPKDFNVGINYSGFYSDNIFMNASKVKDYISQLDTDLNFSLERFNLYLEASADIYTDSTGFNSFSIEPGVEYRHFLKGRDSVSMGLSYRVLNYKELYTDFNYSGPRFQAGTKFYITPQTLFKVNYRFQSRNYTNYESFDFYNHTAFVEIDRFFKSQTSLRLQAGFNYRYYPHIVEGYDFGDDYNYYNHHGSQGKGNPFGGPHSQNLEYNTLSVPNLYGLVQIAQGIGTRFAITGEAEIRHNFQGLDLDRAETLIKNAYVLYPLNDDYLWDGSRLSLKLNIVLFKTLSLEGEFSYFDKDYPGIYIMDAEDNAVEPLTQRKDSLLFYQLKMSKRIGKFDLFSRLSYRDNDSTDDYFLYKMLTISAGIGYYF